MSKHKAKRRSFLDYVVIILALVMGIFLARGLYHGAATLHELLTENKKLKQAITNLTNEDQIGYAKVVSQEYKEDILFTTIRFVETSRGDKLRKILEKNFTVEGDIVHFDTLIVKFGDKMVMDGKSRAMYLWRRIYGEKMTPEEGFDIEEPGTEPKRYDELLDVLPLEEQELFWSGIWDLANDPNKLREYDITAVYGNTNYIPLRKGLIYVFRITSTGQIYPEVVPDM